MKQLIIEPDGWPCTFAECRPGFFVVDEESLCLKSEYGDDAFTESGEAFWGGVTTKEARAELIVQPVRAVWVEDED